MHEGMCTMSRAITAAVLLLLFLAATPALADTFQITAGELSWGPPSDGLVGTITGNNFSFFACCNDTLQILEPGFLQPGMFTNAGAVLDYGGVARSSGPNSLTVNGMSNSRADARLTFSTPNFVLMPPPTSVSEFFTVQQPFTVVGTITAHGPNVPDPLFTINVAGQGMATGTFRQSTQIDEILFSNLSYVFAAGQIPGGGVIPEPSTVLLVASGLAGLGLWRRRTKSAN
jgi:hypothetical protein